MPVTQRTTITDSSEHANFLSTQGHIYVNQSFPKLKVGYWMSISAASGGTQLPSMECASVLITNLSGNGVMFVGGSDTDAPFSGRGHPLYPSDGELRREVNNV